MSRFVSGCFSIDYLKKHIGILSLLLITAVWTLYIFNKSAPAVDGWYMVYAQMIIDGKAPYKDFELLYPPLYTYIVTTGVMLFGNHIIIVRIMGIVTTFTVTILSYLLLRRIVSPVFASLAAVAGIFILSKDPFYLIGDYHFYYMTFGLAQILFALKSVDNIDSNKSFIYAGLSGLFCSLCFLTRSQTGLPLLLFTVIAYLFVFKIKNVEKSKRIKIICYHLLSFAIPIVICLILIAIFSSLSGFIEMVYLGGSKGSVPYIVSYQLIKMLKQSKSWVIIILIPLFSYLLFANKEMVIDDKERINGKIVAIASAIIVFSMIVLFVSSTMTNKADFFLRNNLFGFDDIFVIAMVIVVELLVCLLIRIKKQENSMILVSLLYICGSFFLIEYCSIFSGDPCNYSSGFLLSFIVVFVYLAVNHVDKKVLRSVFKSAVSLIPIFLIIGCVSSTLLCPYQWWCSNEESVYNCTYNSNIDYFSGIQMSLNEKNTYEDFVSVSHEYLEDGDALYCYANTPQFYTLADTMPVVRTIVPFFDICRQDAVLEDLRYLQDNNPKMIVFTDHGQEALDFHSYQYGYKYGNEAMYKWLLSCRDDSSMGYEVIRTYNLGAPIYVMVKS